MQDWTDVRVAALLVANLGTRRFVGCPAAIADQRGVPQWHERGYDADSNGTAMRRLPIR